MGASTRRKELRKAKFSDRQHNYPITRDATPEITTSTANNLAVPDQSLGVNKHAERAVIQNNGTALQSPIYSSRKDRFVCFIGNLPFSTTSDALSAHFRKLKPTSLRHSISKESGKSRGFAFVEFEGYDRMQTCLKLYHHSPFDDGISPTRKINVELTAGGGGASQNRKAKLRLKNEKLEGERKRRANGGGKSGGKSKQTSEQYKNPVDDSGIHPSRRAQVANKG